MGFYFLLINSLDSNIECEDSDFNKCIRVITELKRYFKTYLGTGFLFALLVLSSLAGKISHIFAILNTLTYLYVVFFYDNTISLSHYGGAITKLIGLSGLIWLIIGSLSIFLF